MNRPRVRAHAKVNLSLRVLDRRSDGFHDLETFFQAIDLHDVLDIERGGVGVSLTVTGDDVGPVEDNLVARAARGFMAKSRAAVQGVRIRLEKRIPAGAGLGGGSSDAAATLRARFDLSGSVSAQEIQALAESLGSDVPFFLNPSPLAIGRGRGERIEPLAALPSLMGVVVLPRARVATAGAYRELDRRREAVKHTASAPLAVPSDWDDVARHAANDFEPVVAPPGSEVGAALEALRGTKPLVALLSGSGSASFALYASDEAAAGAAERLADRSELTVFPIRTLAEWPDRA